MINPGTPAHAASAYPEGMTRPDKSGLLSSGPLRFVLALLPFLLASSAARPRRGGPRE